MPIVDDVVDASKFGYALHRELTNRGSVATSTSYLNLRGWTGVAADPSEHRR